jgi:hypothetical protein
MAVVRQRRHCPWVISTPSVSQWKPNNSLPAAQMGRAILTSVDLARGGLSKACLMFSCKQRKGYLNKVDILSVWLQLRDSKKRL